MRRLKFLLTCLVIVILLGIFATQIAPHDPTQIAIGRKLEGISRDYWLGTDYLGRCLLSRLLFGIRTSVFYSMIITVFSLAVGVTVGIVAGYSKGWLDNLLMRLVDLVLSFPSHMMTFAIIGMLGVGGGNLILASVLVRWAWYARMIRTSVVRYRKTLYVQFAQISGRSPGYIIRRHIVPDIFNEIAIYASMDVGMTLLTISGFSFLGLGVQALHAEWGMMLNEAKNNLATNPLQMLPSGLAIVLMVILMNSLGDAINHTRRNRRHQVEHTVIDREQFKR